MSTNFTVTFQIPPILAQSELLESLLTAVQSENVGKPFLLRVDTDENEQELLRVLLLCLKQNSVDDSTNAQLKFF